MVWAHTAMLVAGTPPGLHVCMWCSVCLCGPSAGCSLVCGAVPLEPVVSCVSVSASTLDAILDLMSLYVKELGKELEEEEARLGREGRRERLFAQPNSQCKKAEVGRAHMVEVGGVDMTEVGGVDMTGVGGVDMKRWAGWT